ncbi:hypothetical protein HPB48_002420 [Haemaphysalis longicornis]|uniref:ATP-dependent DNA helicase n=1 Tax=Haemaphysalis longicornis TaxID=44386 RepID=A0A9J6FCB4_HAELO|nr:hypothetical protein HPB48_002420 [Haemaphysalis longicornis]
MDRDMTLMEWTCWAETRLWRTSRFVEGDGRDDMTMVNYQRDGDVLRDPEYVVVIPSQDGPWAEVHKCEDALEMSQYYAKVRLTSPEQREFIHEVIHRLPTPDSKPLRVFCTGPAGCRKTFVLGLVMDTAVAVVGIAVHVAFKLTRRNDGCLSDADLNTFRVVFRHGRALIVGEVSMLPADLLDELDDNRLWTITHNLRKPFGGLDVIFRPPERLAYSALHLTEDEVRLLESRSVLAADALMRAPMRFDSSQMPRSPSSTQKSHCETNVVLGTATDVSLGYRSDEERDDAVEKTLDRQHRR